MKSDGGEGGISADPKEYAIYAVFADTGWTIEEILKSDEDEQVQDVEEPKNKKVVTETKIFDGREVKEEFKVVMSKLNRIHYAKTFPIYKLAALLNWKLKRSKHVEKSES